MMSFFMRNLCPAVVGIVGFFGVLNSSLVAQNLTKDNGLDRCYIEGVSRLGLCRSYDLPLDYDHPDDAMISVHVAVLPASGAQLQPDPIFVFAGGPGQAASEIGALAEVMFRTAGRRHDIILIDARGTGKSTPLQCEFEDSERAFDPDYVGDVLKECRNQFDFDVRHINLETITRDFEEIRQKLGLGQINLWGGSYGTRKAAHYLRRYGENVRAVIVDAILPPDVPLFETIAASTERARREMVNDCVNSESCNARYPTLSADIDELMRQAKEGELIFKGQDPFSGKKLEFKVGFEIAVESLRSVMYAADGTIILPFAVSEALSGNLLPLLAGRFSPGGDPGGLYIGMTLSVLCGESVARISSEAAEAAGHGSFAADSYYSIWANSCKNWDYFTVDDGLPSDIHEPISSDVPTLLLSGYLDPITPPSMGDHWQRTFPNSKHIVVNGTGHITSYTGCMPELIGEFLKDLNPSALDDTCLAHLRRLPLVTGANGQVN